MPSGQALTGVRQSSRAAAAAVTPVRSVPHGASRQKHPDRNGSVADLSGIPGRSSPAVIPQPFFPRRSPPGRQSRAADPGPGGNPFWQRSPVSFLQRAGVSGPGSPPPVALPQSVLIFSARLPAFAGPSARPAPVRPCATRQVAPGDIPDPRATEASCTMKELSTDRRARRTV